MIVIQMYARTLIQLMSVNSPLRSDIRTRRRRIILGTRVPTGRYAHGSPRRGRYVPSQTPVLKGTGKGIFPTTLSRTRVPTSQRGRSS